MNALAAIFVIISSSAILTVARKWAPLPLIVGCCYMTMGQGIVLGPIHLPVYRILLLIGALRVLLRGERFGGGVNMVDRLIIAWSVWMMIASFSHKGIGAGPIFASGIVFNIALSYFLFRIFCRNAEEVVDLIKVLSILLLPIALEMIQEKITGKNLFGVFGGVSEDVLIRADRLRAQGPFRHPILAGTVGAASVPLMIGIWRENRLAGTVGLVSAVVMIIASTSSGPIMTLAAALFALLLWKRRDFVRTFRIIGVVGYCVLNVLMSRPAYYLISRIDLAGGSTGYFRARLIDQTIAHFSEWWLFGTDYTRGWMPTGLSDTQTDITNYYILFGIWAGFLSMLLLVAIFWSSFTGIGHALRANEGSPEKQFFIWCIGAGLFAHAITCISVSYFDQSQLFLWLNIAVISSLRSSSGITLENVSDDNEASWIEECDYELTAANARLRPSGYRL